MHGATIKATKIVKFVLHQREHLLQTIVLYHNYSQNKARKPLKTIDFLYWAIQLADILDRLKSAGIRL
jgi:hypothetical protein